MRYLFSLAFAGGLIAAATPALAQETAPFTGPHIEALAGYDNLSGGDDGVDDSVDGLQYGIGAGYDFQFGGVIAGIEGEFAGSTTKARGRDIFAPGDGAELRAGRDLYVGGRIGVAATPSTLIYLKGGYTNTRLNLRAYDANGYFETGNNLDGYRVGAGIEQKFNLFGPSGFVKAEYRYSNYSNLNIGRFNADVDIDRHQVVAGVGVRF
ncbi:outer membrane beta-barrel protein [Sphingobium sufflavum]|uniref:outer membrane protein n=1 Tax=Sphingobium sufflavum TaxID=1129547 RepID=UPI001F17BF09|nr:outer membrane beta-barrel protein [Sphingobium sufflavum]MCE7797653.1 outer membrane beta-barrel protein [Sphingobium sufflavum]